MSNKVTKSAVQHPSKHDTANNSEVEIQEHPSKKEWMAKIDKNRKASRELIQYLYSVATTPEQIAYLEQKLAELEEGDKATMAMATSNDQMYSALKLNLDTMEAIRTELQQLKETVANLSDEADAKAAKRIKRATRDAYREGQWDAVRSGQVRASNVKRY